jgi:hypothetical protein
MDPLAGLVPAEPELPDADDDGDADELGVDDADCADVVCAVVVAALLLDASATPAPPAPSPAATTPVMMSRRVRPPDLETIVGSPFSTAVAECDGGLSGTSLCGRPARRP